MKYGVCSCGNPLEPVWFVEHETDRYGIKTGRVRDSVSHLVCENCGKSHIVDDSFDLAWHHKSAISNSNQPLPSSR